MIAAMKQALEFILKNPPDTRTTPMALLQEREATISRLTNAIAEAEKAEPDAWIGTDPEYHGYEFWKDKPSDTLIRDFAAQPLFLHPAPIPEDVKDSEPVAWRLYKDGELYALKYEKEDRGSFYTWEPLFLHPAATKEDVKDAAMLAQKQDSEK